MLPHPWMQLYTRDWLDNKELRRCSPASRAVLLDLMCLAHEGIPYGHLADRIGPLTNEYMASRCVVPTDRFVEILAELQSNQRVMSDDNHLVIPRMIKDGAEKIRRAEAGGKGGNPKLVNREVNRVVNDEVNHLDKLARARRASDFVSDSSSLSSSSNLKKNKEVLKSSDDDETANPKREYASAADEVKAIYHAKTGENPTVKLMGMIEATIWGRGKTFDDYLSLLRPHLGNTWKNPPGFLLHMAKTGFNVATTAPLDKPKPRCSVCQSSNGHGAILQDGNIAACPKCSSPEWREELRKKEQQRREKALLPA